MHSYRSIVIWLAVAMHFALGSNRFPDSFRVEVELISFDNPGSADKNGEYCDPNGSCDTSIAAFIDLETSRKRFVSAASHAVVYRATDVDSPTINTVVAKDICGGGIHIATLRAFIYDADPGNARNVIDEFDCRFYVNPNDIPESAETAVFGTAVVCSAHYRVEDHRLFARIRIHKMSAPDCLLIENSNSTVPQDWIMQKNAMKFQSISFQPDRYPAMRLEIQPVNLTNPKGITFMEAPCGNDSTACDPLVIVKLDTDNAMSGAAWNESDSKFAVLGHYANTNSPVMGDVLMHDICGGELDWINMRVIVKNAPAWPEEKLKWNELTTIEEFDCPTRFVYWLAGTSSDSAAWGPVHLCFPRHPSGIMLGYRIRAYPVPVNQCEVRDRFGLEAAQTQNPPDPAVS